MAIQRSNSVRKRTGLKKVRQQSKNKQDRRLKIALKQAHLAAQQGKQWAVVHLGAYYEMQQDFNNAIEQYEKLAVKGDLYYIRRIAVIYEQSIEDLDKAVDWYTEAGHYGDEYAMIRAGNLLELHFGDFDEALLWYRKAAQQNNLAAIYHLCRIYQHYMRDYDTAIEWYKRASKLGDIRAAIALGQLYENALEDYDKAVEWYSVAANQKSIQAIQFLCELYEHKLHNYPRAIEWYKQAVDIYNTQGSSAKPLAVTEPRQMQGSARAQTSAENAATEADTAKFGEEAATPSGLSEAEMASIRPRYDEAEIEFLNS